MKTKFLIFIGIIMSVLACSDDNNPTPTSIEGQYIGVFERNGTLVNVELNFENGTYNGNSEINRFPAICSGSYEVYENNISFQNECIWTADFDWTLILGEEWSYSIENNILTLIKENGDKYILTKQ